MMLYLIASGVSANLLFAVPLATGVGYWARRRPIAGAMLGIVFGPFGWLLVFLLTDLRVFCPACRSQVEWNASLCPYCRSELSPLKARPKASPSDKPANAATYSSAYRRNRQKSINLAVAAITLAAVVVLGVVFVLFLTYGE